MLRIPAENPSPWTGPEGNNTYLLPGAVPTLVDAGVGVPAHLDAVAGALGESPLALVLITHSHPDHIGGVPALLVRWPDHFCFFDEQTRDLYCGDLARRGGTIVVPASKGGNLAEYLASLRRIRDLAPARLLPGHGPIIEDVVELIDEYVKHRTEREHQVLDALQSGCETITQLVGRIYSGLHPSVVAAAADSMLAHLIKLRDEGRVVELSERWHLVE